MVSAGTTREPTTRTSEISSPSAARTSPIIGCWSGEVSSTPVPPGPTARGGAVEVSGGGAAGVPLMGTSGPTGTDKPSGPVSRGVAGASLSRGASWANRTGAPGCTGGIFAEATTRGAPTATGASAFAVAGFAVADVCVAGFAVAGFAVADVCVVDVCVAGAALTGVAALRVGVLTAMRADVLKTDASLASMPGVPIATGVALRGAGVVFEVSARLIARTGETSGAAVGAVAVASAGEASVVTGANIIGGVWAAVD